MAVRVAVFAGSERQGSFNIALARLAAARAAAHGAQVRWIDLGALDLPLYAARLEAEDFPPAALTLKAALVDSDALLIASPEHNGSVSSLLKNAIDWASRPTDGESPVALAAFRGKTAGIMGASVSPFGGLRGLMHLRQILGTVQAIVVPEQLAVPLADRAFAEDGSLHDPLFAGILDALVARTLGVADRLRG